MSVHFKEEFITDTESGSSEEASGSEEDVASWISWFCSLKGNEFFCEIEEDYIQDDFNLSGLCSQARDTTWQLLQSIAKFGSVHLVILECFGGPFPAPLLGLRCQTLCGCDKCLARHKF